MSSAPYSFDALSGTRPLPSVVEGMRRFLGADGRNPWSAYAGANAAREAMQFAREQIAQCFGADDSYEVVFTGTGSEANNLVVKGRAFSAGANGARLVCAASDHPSIIHAMDFMETLGSRSRKLPVDGQGFLAPEQWQAELASHPALACTHLANHDLGTVQPVRVLVQIARAAGVPVLVDATYAGMWVDFSLKDCPADFLTLSPHRFHGPTGIGVLIKKRDIPLTSLIHGGLQENGLRAGHENLPAIYGAGLAAQFARENREKFLSRPRHLQKDFLAQIAPVPDVRLNGPKPEEGLRVGNSLSLSVAGVDAAELVLVCDRFGLELTGGSACVSRTGKIPHTLRAIGREDETAEGTVLIGFDLDNSPEQIAPAAAVFAKAVERVRNLSPRWKNKG